MTTHTAVQETYNNNNIKVNKNVRLRFRGQQVDIRYLGISVETTLDRIRNPAWAMFPPVYYF